MENLTGTESNTATEASYGVQPDNALKAADYLLELDKSTICEVYRLDAAVWVAALKTAQGKYYQVLADYPRSSPIPTLSVDPLLPALHTLTECAREVAAILSEEARQHLEDYLHLSSTRAESE